MYTRLWLCFKRCYAVYARRTCICRTWPSRTYTWYWWTWPESNGTGRSWPSARYENATDATSDGSTYVIKSIIFELDELFECLLLSRSTRHVTSRKFSVSFCFFLVFFYYTFACFTSFICYLVFIIHWINETNKQNTNEIRFLLQFMIALKYCWFSGKLNGCFVIFTFSFHHIHC
jgi:hypothetical protein